MYHVKTVIFLLCFICLSISASVLDKNVDLNDYDDLDRSRRNTVSIADTVSKTSDCIEFVNYCKSQNDLQLLFCASKSKDPKSNPTTPVTCVRRLDSYITKLLKSQILKELAKQYCGNDFAKDCSRLAAPDRLGSLLMCLVENANNARTDECTKFTQELKYVPRYLFTSDVLTTLLEECKDDMIKLQCKNQRKEGGGTAVLSCLQAAIDQVKDNCKDDVLALSELQGDGGVSTALGRACHSEADLFCPDISPSDVDSLYHCLNNNRLHRENPRISHKCLDEMYNHEKMISKDYQISRALVKACKEDIRLYQCRKSVSSHKYIRLSQILLCLENASHSGYKVKTTCTEEMVEHRRMLMEDYRLSPEVVTRCADELRRLCRVSPGSLPGTTIHCLMKHSRSSSRPAVSDQCQRELETLVKEADVAENWQVDPYLYQACQTVFDIVCRKPEAKANPLSCLMERLGSDMMTEDCEVALLEVQYFVARDYKLEPRLFRACHKAAESKCHAASDWARGPASTDPERGPLVLPCLYRLASLPPDAQETEISHECVVEIKRVMRERALSVELHPEVEQACIQDLALFCVERTASRQEINCLQDKLEQLSPACKTAVYNFTEIQAAHLEMHPIIMSNCKQIMDALCSDVIKKGSGAEDVMDCLITNKNHQLMKFNTKCRAAVEHHQIISLKDYHFTIKFKEACKLYVSRFCSGPRTKTEVVSCLSEVMRNDTLLDQKQRIPRECRQQVRSQLLQSRETITLNPVLARACAREVSKFCRKVTPGNANVLECLEQHRKQLTGECHAVVFRAVQQDLTDSSSDYTLLTTCQKMIAKYCRQENTTSALNCLKEYKYLADFEPGCRVIVIRRLIEQYSDIRLNMDLLVDCRRDVAQHCSAVLAHPPSDDTELHGKVINCLKNKFREGRLEKDCEKRLVSVLRESALNYQLNPLLSELCKDEIKQVCGQDVMRDELGGGSVEECLKRALVREKLKSEACRNEVLELIRQRRVDIEADPALHTACLADLSHYCTDRTRGDRRQLECLIELLEANSRRRQLQAECSNILRNRLEMYKVEHAARVADLGELYAQMNQSPSRKYFMLVAITAIGMVFITGMFCGRLVRRSHTLSKNK